MNANCETGRTYYFLFYYLWRLFPLLQNADSYVSLDKFLYYLSLKFLLVWILLQFRSCSCLTFAACFAAASSSGAYSSNVFSSFTAPSFTVAVFLSVSVRYTNRCYLWREYRFYVVILRFSCATR